MMMELITAGGVVELSQIYTIATVLAVALAFVGAPLWVWSILIVSGVVLSGLSLIPNLIIAGLLLCLNVSAIRRYIVSLPIMKAMIAFKFLPTISETEKVAIEAGDVWVDKELFSGKPNMKVLMSQKLSELTSEEQAFIDGPVNTLCEMINDWQIHKSREISDEIWNFIKKEKFFGLIIPKEYGGLGFSPEANSQIITKCASRSGAIGITVMVPNSLGPAELLTHYGTQAQKDHYLPRLADGREVPCFGLTEPGAGSDAGAMTSSGVVFKGDDGKLYIRLNWKKRWITLSGVSTVIGLAFKLFDPENLIGNTKDIGITCALIPSDTKGIKLDKQHDPLGVVFNNCPIIGKDVVVSIDAIIGGVEYAGKGWFMLMECLSAGRGISLPASCTGGSVFMTRATAAFSMVRQQFGTSIGNFEGLHRPLATIAGYNYLFEAARLYTSSGVGEGISPPIISAICKYQFTEMSREMCQHSMDIFAGAGISLGPKNLVAKYHLSNPISITVEGANILTRTLMVFGQGAIRCHPYILKEIQAIESQNVKQFDDAFMSHIGHTIRNTVRYLLLTLSRGWLSGHVGHRLSKYERKLSWVSAMFACYADIALVTLGGLLKRKENITGRFADVLSWMYLAMTVMKRYRTDNKSQDWIYVQWCLETAFYNCQVAFVELLENMGWAYKIPALILRISPFGKAPSDALATKVSQHIQTPSEDRDRLTKLCFMPQDQQDPFYQLEKAFAEVFKTQPIMRKVKKAVQSKVLVKKPLKDLLQDACTKEVISSAEKVQVLKAEELRNEAIQVDAFTKKEYIGNSPLKASHSAVKKEFLTQIKQKTQDLN